jgi:hypothetical protein
MPIAIRGTVQTATGTPVNHSAIAGITTGDLYIDYLQNLGAAGTLATDPTSVFTSIATAGSGADAGLVARRTRTGTEGTLTASGGSVMGNIFFALSGTSGVVESAQSGTTGFTATHTIPASTPTSDNCWHILFFSNNSNDAVTFVTPPAGYTALSSLHVVGQGRIHAFYRDLGAGSSGVSTGAQSGVWSASCLGLLFGFIVKPDAGGPPPNWTVSNPTVNSDAGTATVVLTLDAPAPAGGVNGFFSTYDITAVAGNDYTSRTAVAISIAEGGTTANLTVPILP